MVEAAATSKQKKGSSKKKKKRSLQTIDLVEEEKVDELKNSSSPAKNSTHSDEIEIIPPVVNSESAKPKKKKKKDKKIQKKTLPISESSGTKPVCHLENEKIVPKEESQEESEDQQNATSKETLSNDTDNAVVPVVENNQDTPASNPVKKRPTAADMMVISDEPSLVTDDSSILKEKSSAVTEIEDSSVSRTEVTSCEPASMGSRRATAVDFMDDSAPVEPKEALTLAPKEDAVGTLQEDKVLPKEEVVEAHSSESAPSQDKEEDQGIGGGLEFLGYPNFDSYSNVLLPAGLCIFSYICPK